MPRIREPFTRKIVTNNDEIVTINLQNIWRNPDVVQEVYKNIKKLNKKI
jgi:hypothetical protein